MGSCPGGSISPLDFGRPADQLRAGAHGLLKRLAAYIISARATNRDTWRHAIARLAVGGCRSRNMVSSRRRVPGVIGLTITGPLCLPPHVLLTPVAELPATTREKLRFEEGDFALNTISLSHAFTDR